MAGSPGKRERERQKLEKARTKAERKAARQVSDVELADGPSSLSETELIEELGALHRAFESGLISPDYFEERRNRLQTQFDQLS
jgi:hypothetical protein